MRQQENHLQHMLASLRTRLLVMCASVGIALEEAGKALAVNDPARALAIIDGDTAIDELENEIDDMALRLLARTQPVAGDLRFVVSALRMVVDLERIGDEAVSMAEQAILLQDTPGYGVLPHVQSMFGKAHQAFERAVFIFRQNDAEAALAMSLNEDDAMQNEVRITQSVMGQIAGSGATLDPHLGMHIILVARSLTRIWRRSINIAEHVYFINQGLTLKHHGEQAVCPLLEQPTGQRPEGQECEEPETPEK